MRKLLNRKKQKKEPVPVFNDPYLEHSNLTFTGGVCGTTITNGTTYLVGSDLVSSGSCSTSLFVSNGTSFTSIAPKKTIEDYRKDIKSIPPKKLIHKFLNNYVGDEFRLSEKKDNPTTLNPYVFKVHSQELVQIVSNNNVDVLSYYMAYGVIIFNINKTLVDTVSDYLQIPYEFAYPIIKQWFWEKNNFFSDSGLELSKFIP